MCITTDNGSNIVCATKVCLGWNWLPCFGHNLHLTVTNTIKEDARATRALSLSRKLISTFSHSWKKKRSLIEAQNELSLPNHSLIVDCATRWGSTEVMINRILEQKSAIQHVLSSDRKTRHLCPTWQDIDVLESLHAVLSPLHDFTDALSGEQRVTISVISAIPSIFKKDILATCQDDITLTADIKSSIMEYMEGKYSDSCTRELLHVSSYLDPWFCTTYIPDDEKDSTLERIADEGLEMFSQIQINQVAKEPIDVSSSTTSSPPPKRRKLGSWIKKSLAAEPETLCTQEKVER